MFTFGREEDTISLSDKAEYEAPTVPGYIFLGLFGMLAAFFLGSALVLVVIVIGLDLLAVVPKDTVEAYIPVAIALSSGLLGFVTIVYLIYDYYSSRKDVKRTNRKDHGRAQELYAALKPFRDPDLLEGLSSESRDWLPYSIQLCSDGYVQAVIKASDTQREATIRISVPSKKALKQIRKWSKESLREAVNPFGDNSSSGTHSAAAIESVTFPPNLQDWDDGEALLDRIQREISRTGVDDISALTVQGIRMSDQHILATRLAFKERAHVFLPWGYLKQVHKAVGEVLGEDVEGPRYPKSSIMDQIRS